MLVSKPLSLLLLLLLSSSILLLGDITPYDGISKTDKRKMEEDALKQMVIDIDNDVGEDIYKLWLEYEEGTSIEAELARQLDKLEMIIQADEYEKEQQLFLPSFFDSTIDSFTHPEIKSWADKLRHDRQQRISSSSNSNSNSSSSEKGNSNEGSSSSSSSSSSKRDQDL